MRKTFGRKRVRREKTGLPVWLPFQNFDEQIANKNRQKGTEGVYWHFSTLHYLRFGFFFQHYLAFILFNGSGNLEENESEEDFKIFDLLL